MLILLLEFHMMMKMYSEHKRLFYHYDLLLESCVFYTCCNNKKNADKAGWSLWDSENEWQRPFAKKPASKLCCSEEQTWLRIKSGQSKVKWHTWWPMQTTRSRGHYYKSDSKALSELYNPAIEATKIQIETNCALRTLQLQQPKGGTGRRRAS